MQFSKLSRSMGFVISGHATDSYGVSLESVNFVGNTQKGNKDYGTDYNQKWQSQLNYSWANNKAYIQQFQQYQSIHYNTQARNIEKTLKKILLNQEQMVSRIKYQQLAQKNLETQLGQLDQAQNTRPQGSLPSNIENQKQVKSTTLRSGRDLIC